MSAGPFTVVGYLAQYGTGTNVHPIRVQPETLILSVTIGGVATTNDGEPVDDITNPISAIVSRGRRARGLIARTITVKFVSDVPDGYRLGSPITLPALNASLLAAPNGATGTYLGEAITVVGTSPEIAK